MWPDFGARIFDGAYDFFRDVLDGLRWADWARELHAARGLGDLAELGFGHDRVNAGDRDLVRTKLDAQGFREAELCRFCCAIRAEIRHAAAGGGAGDDHDLPALP